MYLKSIEINGFKSFGKKSDLFFNKSVTAIVGPNGSGKSNVAEAFRFVLGEQSTKSMRGKRTEDLIFNGSGDTQKSNRASVKLIFDNKDNFFNINFKEVVLERVIHRDGASEYFINNSKSRLKDFFVLLSGVNIGSSGHHIISQGEADRVLNASVKEKRDIIEDAIGLKSYQYKKEESIKKLEKTEDNIKEIEGLRKEILPHLNFLKKQIEKIEKTREFQKELSLLYREFFKRETLFISETSRVFEIERNKLAKEQEDLFLKQQHIATKLKDNNIKIFTDKLSKIRDVVNQKNIEKNNLLRELGKAEGMIDFENSRIEKIIQNNKNLDNRSIYYREIKDVFENIKNEIKNNNLNKILEIINNYNAKFSKEEVSVDDSMAKDLGLKLSKLKQELKYFDDEITKIKTEEDKINKEKNVFESSFDLVVKEKYQIEMKIRDIENRLLDIKREEEVLRSIDDRLKDEIREAVALIGREASLFVDFEIKGGSVSREDQEVLRKKIERLKIKLEESGISGVGEVEKEYKDTEERERFLSKEIEDLNNTKETLKILIKDIDENINKLFKEGIEKINMQFKDLFKLMFGGGEAKLLIVKSKKRNKNNSENNLEAEEEDDEEGIDIDVSLPNKKVKGLSMLSGGERALVSIALLFALSQVNPPPFIILDETDAALDEANSKKYGDMIENLARNSQLIVITHNRETMSRASLLYGVTMSLSGVSKLLSISFDEASLIAK